MRSARLSKAIALFVALIFPIQNTSAATISGTKCAKQGATKTSANIKYTCIKSSKKLIWNKGVKIKTTPKPIPTLEPTVTPTPAPSATPTPSPTPSKTPELSISERWNALDQTASNVWKSANALSIPNTHSNTFIWQTSDKADAGAVEEIKKRYDLSARWWAPIAKSANPLKILIANHNEANWICGIKLPWLGTNQPDCAEIESNGRSDIPTAGQSQWQTRQIDMYQVKNREEMNTFFFYGRIEHEFTHNIFYAQGTNYQKSVPCWMTEGGAEFFGNLMAFGDNADLYIQVRNAKVYDRQLKNQSAADWLNYINRADGTDNFSDQGDNCGPVRPEIYHHAILPNEFLHSKLGTEGFLKLMKEASSTSWSAAIQKTFNKPKSEIYQEMATYMKTQYDLIAANQWSIQEIRKIPFGR